MKSISATIVAALLLAALQPCNAAGRRDGETANRKRSENMERAFKHFYEKENARFGQKLKKLAAWCAEKGLNEQASDVWAKAREMDPEIEGEAPSDDAAAPTAQDEAQFAKRKKKLFEEHARELLALGKKCYKTGLIGRAYDMVSEVVLYKPHHATARKLLGQVKYKDGWLDIYDAMQMRRGKVFTDEYGWVRKRDLPKYEQGLLPIRGRWVAKEKVEEIRKSWVHAWKYNTEHFEINTNVGLADAVAFGKIVEDNYDLFFRVFIGYFSSKSQTGMLFGSQRVKRRMKVNYFAEEEQYLKSVKYGPGTAGIYLGERKTSNFFKTNLESNICVVKHETTHQMFAETKKSRDSWHGAWVVEATATYMETCTRKDGKIVTEGKKARWVERFIPMLKINLAVPLKRFDHATYGGFQNFSPMAYPQAAALGLFFMESEDGKYRERFVDYVTAFYSGKFKDSGALARYIGVPLNRLETEFYLYYLGEEGLKELEKFRTEQEKATKNPKEEEKEEKEKETESDKEG